MANTWLGTPLNGLTEKRAIYDAVENEGIAVWVGGTAPTPSWATDDTVCTWTELAAAVVLQTSHPTGASCPSRTEAATWFDAPDPTVSSCVATGGVGTANITFNTNADCQSVRIRVFDDLDQLVTSRDINTPGASSEDEDFGLAAGDYYFTVTPYSLPNQGGTTGSACRAPSTGTITVTGLP